MRDRLFRLPVAVRSAFARNADQSGSQLEKWHLVPLPARDGMDGSREARPQGSMSEVEP